MEQYNSSHDGSFSGKDSSLSELSSSGNGLESKRLTNQMQVNIKEFFGIGGKKESKRQTKPKDKRPLKQSFSQNNKSKSSRKIPDFFESDLDDDFTFPKQRKSSKGKCKGSKQEPKLGHFQLQSLSHNIYNESSEDEGEYSYEQALLPEEMVEENKQVDEEVKWSELEEKTGNMPGELIDEQVIEKEIVQEREEDNLAVDLQLMKGLKFDFANFVSADCLNQGQVYQDQQKNQANIQEKTQAHTQQKSRTQQQPAVIQLNYQIISLLSQLQPPKPKSKPIPKPKRSKIPDKPSLFVQLFPQLLKFDSHQHEQQQIFYEDDQNQNSPSNKIISSARISSILSRIEYSSANIKLQSKLQNSDIKPGKLSDIKPVKPSSKIIRKSSNSNPSKLNHHNPQIKLENKPFQPKQNKPFQTKSINPKNQPKPTQKSQMTPAQLSAYKIQQALVKRRLYRRSRSRKAKIQALTQSKHPNGISINIQNVTIKDYFISSALKLHHKERPSDIIDNQSDPTPSIYYNNSTTQIPKMNPTPYLSPQPASSSYALTSSLIKNPHSLIYQIKRTFNCEHSCPYLTPSSTSVTAQQFLLPYHKHTQRQINRLMRPKPVPNFVITNFDSYLKQKQLQKEYWAQRKSSTIDIDDNQPKTKINLGYFDLQQVLYELYSHNIISQQIFYEFMGSNGTHQTKTFLKRLHDDQLHKFNFARSRFTLADHRRASELLTLLYPHQYQINRIQVFHHVVQSFLVDLYRLTSDSYNKLCAKIDSYVNNLFWVKLQLKYQLHIKGELIDDTHRQQHFVKRETSSGVQKDLQIYHKTIGFDNLFPSEEIRLFKKTGSKMPNSPNNLSNPTSNNPLPQKTPNIRKRKPPINRNSTQTNLSSQQKSKSSNIKPTLIPQPSNKIQVKQNHLGNNLLQDQQQNKRPINILGQKQKNYQAKLPVIRTPIQPTKESKGVVIQQKQKSKEIIYKQGDLSVEKKKKQKQSKKKKSHSKSKKKSKKHIDQHSIQEQQKEQPKSPQIQYNQHNKVSAPPIILQESPIPLETNPKTSANFTIKLPQFNQKQMQENQNQPKKDSTAKTPRTNLQKQQKLIGVDLQKIDTKSTKPSLRSKPKLNEQPAPQPQKDKIPTLYPNSSTLELTPTLTSQNTTKNNFSHDSVNKNPEVPKTPTPTIEPAKILLLSEKVQDLNPSSALKQKHKQKKQTKPKNSQNDKQKNEFFKQDQPMSHLEDQSSTIIKQEPSSESSSLSNVSSSLSSSLTSNTFLQSSGFASSASSSDESDASSDGQQNEKTKKLKQIKKRAKGQKEKRDEQNKKSKEKSSKKSKKEKKHRKKLKKQKEKSKQKEKHKQKGKKKKKIKNQSSSQPPIIQPYNKNLQPSAKENPPNQQELETLRKKLKKIKKNKKIQKMKKKIEEYNMMKKLYKKKKSQKIFMRRVEGFSQGMDQLWKDKTDKKPNKKNNKKQQSSQSDS